MDWDSPYIHGLIELALAEDVGTGDATVEATISPEAAGRARVVAGQEVVCAGLPLAERIFRALDPAMKVTARENEGQLAHAGEEVLQLSGKAAAILTGERTALNFLGRLSGIATLTRAFVKQLSGSKTQIRGTRKTTPGLRLLEQYAVQTGGGTNHRIGLFDAILLKEAHIATAGGVKAALDQAHSYASTQMKPRALTAYEAVGDAPADREGTSLPIQIEVRHEDELREALDAGAESVLLEHMTPDKARCCVEIVRGIRASCVVEISGGITLANVRRYAETGADYLSSGALTQSAPNADFRLLVDSIG